ncbi:MAG TPA: hypothetical protein DCL43_01290 [Chitinophagaceae bacterium]|nr:hypothetical protein [Chitinophagaceae bacterium]
MICGILLFFFLYKNNNKKYNEFQELNGSLVKVKLISYLNNSKRRVEICVVINSEKRCIDVSDSFMKRQHSKDSVLLSYDTERDVLYDENLSSKYYLYTANAMLIFTILISVLFIFYLIRPSFLSSEDRT